MAYAPIHNHTEYSALDGLSSCREIAERCKCLGCSAVGITDHGTVAGHLEFAKVLAEYDIKPIFGCELYHGIKTEFAKNERDASHLVAGSLTDQGLRNLWRLVDKASTNFRFVGRVNWQMLDDCSEGLFCTSACVQGLMGRGIRGEDGHDPYDALNRYLEIFKDNFYIEIHTYPGEMQEQVNKELVSIAQERGVPLIYATDAHFASPDQYEIHDAYVAMQTGDSIFTPVEERKMWHPKALYIQGEEEIRQSLSYLPDNAVDEALRNSGELADRCNAQLPEVRRHMPQFVTKECPWVEDHKVSPAVLLVELTAQGLSERYDDWDGPWERAERELEVFLEAGLEHYFLQVWDLCQYAEANGIKRGPGRGSAAGSIVAYALGITDVDPLKYDLIFERFYNPGREKGYPDIDIDFPTGRRKDVREYLSKRWGQDRVRTIGTITRMKPKAAIDSKLYKACRIEWKEKEELKAIIDKVPDIDILGPDSIGWDSEIDPGKTIYVMDHVGDEIKAWLAKQPADRRDLLEYWIEIVRVICSRVANHGVHPSGVVVSDVDLADELPCMWNSSQKIQVTCFPMSDVDLRKFLKDDLLGLRNLDTLEEWEREVGFTPPWSTLTDTDLPEEGWELLDKGLTLGVFQIEDGYARRLCKDFKPRSIEDLGIIVSLNRPGPIRSGAPDSFIARRAGREEVTYDHPILEDILEPTYGWFLYQEQVIRFFAKLGLSESDADAVRKILGKKKPEDMRALRNGDGEWKGKGYFDLALKVMNQTTADLIWNKLEDFAKYSFNKSHAIAYGTLAFRTLFAKYWATPEFIMACIRTNADDSGAYVAEGRRLGITVNPPHILYSEPDIAVKGDHIYFGFSNVKNVGKGHGQYICDLRAMYNISTTDGLFAAVESEQEKWEAARDHAKRDGVKFLQKSPRQRLPQNRIPALWDAGAWDRFEERDISLSERQKNEMELLGVILTDNTHEVFERNADLLESCQSYSELDLSDEIVYVPGVVAAIRPLVTKKDKKSMGVVTIEYEDDQAEFVVFPQQWQNYKFLWKERTPAVFGLASGDKGLRFETATRLH